MESDAVAEQPINNSIATKIYATFSQYITKPLPLGSFGSSIFEKFH